MVGESALAPLGPDDGAVDAVPRFPAENVIEGATSIVVAAIKIILDEILDEIIDIIFPESE